MSKKKHDNLPPVADEVPSAADPAAEVPTAASRPEVSIVLRRELQCGDRLLPAGAALATVRMEPGVSLNYLARCVEDAFAGPAD